MELLVYNNLFKDAVYNKTSFITIYWQNIKIYASSSKS